VIIIKKKIIGILICLLLIITISSVTAQQIIQTSIVNVISPLEQNITIVDFQYIPANITISIGTKVIWTNNGPSPHTVTSDTNIFNSENMGVGAKWNYTFNQSGSFPYHCAIHPSMLGIVIVTGGENFPPNKPTLDGPSSVKTGIAIRYTAVTTDPEGDNIQYYFDWGDGTNTGWLSEVASGTISHQSHT